MEDYVDKWRRMMCTNVPVMSTDIGEFCATPDGYIKAPEDCMHCRYRNNFGLGR